MINPFPDFTMVDNSNNHSSSITPMATSQVCCQTQWHWVICCEGENPESHWSIEHTSTKRVLADPLTKGLPPNGLREHTIDMGIW